MSYADLKKWLIFNLLDESICQNIHMAVVCDIPNNEALIVTEDRKVYALTINKSSYSESNGPSINLAEVEILRNKKLKKIVYGSDGHILALTKNGRVYAWGENKYHQVSRHSTNNYENAMLLTSTVQNMLMVDIACGPNHSLAITPDGSVYTWGKDVISAKPIVLGEAACVAISIDCGPCCNLVVLVNGDCYYWRNNESSTTKLDISTPLQKVACALDHFLVLNNKGCLYVGDYTDNGKPACNFNYSSQVRTKMGLIIDIAAHHSSDVSAAINQEGKVFILRGLCKIGFPYCTPFTNLHDVFALCTQRNIMHRPLILDRVQEPVNILEYIKTAFNDMETSDLVFKVDEKSIYVHKSFLRMRSPFFRAKFKEIWTNSDPSVLEYDLFNYDVYKSFFKYLYTGEVDIQAEHALDLWKAGDLYMEPSLCKLCLSIVKQTMTVENVVTLYAQAVDYNCEDMKIICSEFSSDCMTDVFLSPAFRKGKEAIMKEFVISVAECVTIEK